MADRAALMEQTKQILREQSYYRSAGALMSWDLWQGLSEDGRPFRNEVSGYFTRQAREHLVSRETAQVVSRLQEFPEEEWSSPYERAAAKLLIKSFQHAVRIPAALQVEMNEFTSMAQGKWRQALQQADFKAYQPYARQLFELKRRTALALEPHEDPFDTLIGEVDEGLNAKETGMIFSVLATGVSKILRSVRERHAAIDDSVLSFDCEHEKKKRITLHILEQTGFDMRKSSFFEVLHPMCTGVGPQDARVTTNYRNLFAGIFSTLHEGGHARYNYSSNQEAQEYSLWGGIGGAMHESQSRFYENMVGKSREFWEYFYPYVQSECPELRKIPLESFYQAVCKAAPGPRRIGADELTYSLHPIIRFEMERDYFAGKIRIEEFEEIWNEKYREYLGVVPQNAAQGVLQDIHWASGHVGYFQSYALGDLYAAQFRHKMLQDRPDAYSRVAKGDFSGINQWCLEQIHQYGRTYTPGQMLQKATGEPLNPQYLLEYLKEKFCTTCSAV